MATLRSADDHTCWKGRLYLVPVMVSLRARNGNSAYPDRSREQSSDGVASRDPPICIENCAGTSI